jgi:hypothetical protein
MTAENILEKLNEALTKFGTYSFDDKGPHEVMNIGAISDYIKTLSKEDAVAIIKEVIDVEGYSKRKVLADAIVGDCDNMPEDWFDYVLDNSGAEY